MKDISTIASNYHPAKQQNKHELSDNINDQVRELVDSVFIQLGSIFPAWKTHGEERTIRKPLETLARLNANGLRHSMRTTSTVLS